MGMISEFKEFISRGNVVDLATAVVIGAAFGKIVDSFVNDVLMPPLSVLTGGRDFSNLFITLGPGSFTTIAEANSTRLPPVRLEKPMVAVSPISTDTRL